MSPSSQDFEMDYRIGGRPGSPSRELGLSLNRVISGRRRRPTLPRMGTSDMPLMAPGATTRPSTPVTTRPSTPKPAESIESPTPSKKWTRGPYFWRSLISICIPLLLSALEASVTNTALPTIADKLNLGTNFTWVATAFLLASTVLQPLYGQVADMYGRKIPILLAVTVFAAGSAISGWAKNPTSLIFGRVIQGFGTGGIDLFVEIILCDLVPLRKRGQYMALKNLFFATGCTMGPMLGGYFAEHNWRLCFWVNLPVCLASFIMLCFWLRVEGGSKKGQGKMAEMMQVDYIGVFLLTASVVLILVPLSSGGTSHPWSSEAVIAPFAFGVLLLILFPIWERSQCCSRPIMPPEIFANRTSATALILTTLHGFVCYGVQFFLPAFFQAVKMVKPSASGVLVLPTSLVIVVMATVGGPLLAWFGKYRPIHMLSFFLMTLGLGFFVLLDRHTPTFGHILMQLTAAIGLGLVVPSLLPAVLVELTDSQNGAAAGAWAFLRGTGSLFGVAIPSAFFNWRFSQLLPHIHEHDVRVKFASGQAYQQAGHIMDIKKEYVRDQVISAFTSSLKVVWAIFIAFSGGAFLLTFLEREVKMRKELDTEFGLSSMPASVGSSEDKEAVTVMKAVGRKSFELGLWDEELQGRAGREDANVNIEGVTLVDTDSPRGSARRGEVGCNRAGVGDRPQESRGGPHIRFHINKHTPSKANSDVTDGSYDHDASGESTPTSRSDPPSLHHPKPRILLPSHTLAQELSISRQRPPTPYPPPLSPKTSFMSTRASVSSEPQPLSYPTSPTKDPFRSRVNSGPIFTSIPTTRSPSPTRSHSLTGLDRTPYTSTTSLIPHATCLSPFGPISWPPANSTAFSHKLHNNNGTSHSFLRKSSGGRRVSGQDWR